MTQSPRLRVCDNVDRSWGSGEGQASQVWGPRHDTAQTSHRDADLEIMPMGPLGFWTKLFSERVREANGPPLLISNRSRPEAERPG